MVGSLKCRNLDSFLIHGIGDSTLGKSLGGISVFSTFHGPLGHGPFLAQSLRHKVLPKTPTLATLLTPCIRAPVLVWMINVS